MNSSLLFLAGVLLLLSCVDSSPFQPLPCDPVRSENDNVRKVFSDCRTFIYEANFWGMDYELLSSERIAVTATGRPWDQQPELQDEIIIQYERGASFRDELLLHSINPDFNNWSDREVTGVIEDGRRVWMHSFRSNQYSFTEVAGFPDIQLPVQRGSRWSRTLNLSYGWGMWSNQTISTLYQVLDEEEVQLPMGPLRAWHVRAITNAGMGRTVHDFWFQEDYGFVKMVIKNYAGQLLTFELSEVRESG